MTQIFFCRDKHLHATGHAAQCVLIAVQVFSKTVASCFQVFGMPAQAYFCQTVNDAFDVMNSSKIYHGFKRLKCAYGINEIEQRAALEEMEKLLVSMKFGDCSEKRARKEMMQFQKVIRFITVNFNTYFTF